MRKILPPEILVWCKKYLDKYNDVEDNNYVIQILEMINIFRRINTVLQQDDCIDIEFCNHVLEQLLFL